MQSQILELRKRGYSFRKISKVLGKSRKTVRKVVGQGREEKTEPVGPEWAQKVDWERVLKEVALRVPIKTLAAEHAGADVSYVQFWRQLRIRSPQSPVVTMRLEHNPGERSFFDFAEGIEIVDRKTGESKRTWFLCGVLPHSSYTYGEFTFTQKQGDLTRAMENAFRFFGGTTPYVTVDNQRAAVSRAHLYDPDVNAGFVDFANHWGFAVVPARPYKPRDKAANESGIGVVQRQFFAEVRNCTFFSLGELNQALFEYLKRLNAAPMKDWGNVTRWERFQKKEQGLLQPLPAKNWEPTQWRHAKVHPDCHVQVEKHFYSVPFFYVGRAVRVRLGAKIVEIFSEDLEPLAVHERLMGQEYYSTNPAHYPEEKLALTQFSIKFAKAEAQKIGPTTLALVEKLLSPPHPLKYLRRVQGVLRPYQQNKISRAALEHASRQALLLGQYSLKFILEVAQFFDKNGGARPVAVAAPIRDPGTTFLHAAHFEPAPNNNVFPIKEDQ